MKNVFLSLTLLVSFFVFSGCSIFPQEQENEVVQSEDEYVIDESDFIKSDELIGDETSGILSQIEIDGILLMREEEKLARDVYEVLGEEWGVKVFSNITRSEQTHINAVLGLLELYSIEDPLGGNDEVGSFTSEEMQTLYDDFIAKGSKTREDALLVGATIEDLDIYDLEVLMGQTENEDLLRVYQNLQKGSRNHMRAFNKQILKAGLEYTPEYISEEQFNSIIAQEQEKGYVK